MRWAGGGERGEGGDGGGGERRGGREGGEGEGLRAPTPQKTVEACNRMLDILIPGHRAGERTANLQRNLCLLGHQPVEMQCTLYVYGGAVTLAPNCQKCTIVRRDGKWVDFMHAFETQADHVLLTMDDVVAEKVSIGRMLAKMRDYELDVLAPSISGWHHPIMRPGYRRHATRNRTLIGRPLFSKKACASGLRRTKYLDMLFVLFTRKAWKCWRRHLDRTNRDGWGHDLLFWRKCRVRMAVDDRSLIRHPAHMHTTYSHAVARDRMHAYLTRETNLTLSRLMRFRFDVLRSETACVLPPSSHGPPRDGGVPFVGRDDWRWRRRRRSVEEEGGR